MSGRKPKLTSATILVAIIATLTVVLPIMVGILAAEIFSEELLAQGAGTQLAILVTALAVLVIINLYALGHTLKFRRK